jgi:hypothetical protein
VPPLGVGHELSADHVTFCAHGVARISCLADDDASEWPEGEGIWARTIKTRTFSTKADRGRSPAARFRHARYAGRYLETGDFRRPGKAGFASIATRTIRRRDKPGCHRSRSGRCCQHRGEFVGIDVGASRAPAPSSSRAGRLRGAGSESQDGCSVCCRERSGDGSMPHQVRPLSWRCSPPPLPCSRCAGSDARRNAHIVRSRCSSPVLALPTMPWK